MERAAVSVLCVERDRLAKDGEGVGDIAGEDRDGVERAAGGDDAGGGESPERRLQPDNAVGRRRQAPPAPAVRVPSENGTRPEPTAVAEPELDPPGMRSERSALRGTP